MISVEAVKQLGRLSCAYGLKEIIVDANIFSLPINANLRHELAVLSRNMDTRYACFISGVALLISSIFSVTYISEISYAVISGVAVDMINGLFWHRAVLVKPCKAMRLPCSAKHGNPNISSAVVGCTHHFANLPSWEGCAELIASRVF